MTGGYTTRTPTPTPGRPGSERKPAVLVLPGPWEVPVLFSSPSVLLKEEMMGGSEGEGKKERKREKGEKEKRKKKGKRKKG